MSSEKFQLSLQPPAEELKVHRVRILISSLVKPSLCLAETATEVSMLTASSSPTAN